MTIIIVISFLGSPPPHPRLYSYQTSCGCCFSFFLGAAYFGVPALYFGVHFIMNSHFICNEQMTVENLYIPPISVKEIFHQELFDHVSWAKDSQILGFLGFLCKS